MNTQNLLAARGTEAIPSCSPLATFLAFALRKQRAGTSWLRLIAFRK